MKYSAILFDLDGTLVDTIDLYGQAVIEALSGYGVHATEEHFRRWYTAGTPFEEIFAEHNLPRREVPRFRVQRDDRYVSLLGQTTWYEGATQLLASLKGRVPIGIVTGSWRRYTDALERHLGLSSFTDTLITADDMDPLHKPHPHCLFLASERLQTPVEECIYIGDQRFDMIAARSARMPNCLVAGNHTPLDAVQYADRAVAELGELKVILD